MCDQCDKVTVQWMTRQRAAEETDRNIQCRLTSDQVGDTSDATSNGPGKRTCE